MTQFAGGFVRGLLALCLLLDFRSIAVLAVAAAVLCLFLGAFPRGASRRLVPVLCLIALVAPVGALAYSAGILS